MQYLDTIELVQNDTLPDIKFTIRDSQDPVGNYLDPRDSDTWKPMDISDKNVYMRIRRLGETATLNDFQLIPLDSANGVVVLRLPSDPKAFPEVGVYEGEVRMLDMAGTGEQTITERFKFRVIEEFL